MKIIYQLIIQFLGIPFLGIPFLRNHNHTSDPAQMILLVKRSGKYFAIGAPKDPPLMLCLKLQYLNTSCKKEKKKNQNNHTVGFLVPVNTQKILTEI